jgi:hypothetical protein
MRGAGCNDNDRVDVHSLDGGVHLFGCLPTLEQILVRDNDGADCKVWCFSTGLGEKGLNLGV